MKKQIGCMLILSSMMLCACGKKQETPVVTAATPEPTTVVDTSWRDGKDYVAYDLSDKNGNRRWWVDFQSSVVTIYEDDGTVAAELQLGAENDIEYIKSGFVIHDYDGDGYLDVSIPSAKDAFGNYTYHWVYNFVDKQFMDKTAELTNEKEVLTQIANGVLGENTSRQITQMFNQQDMGVVNGLMELDNQSCKAYSVVDNGTPSATLCFGSDGTWYIDVGNKKLYSVLDAMGGDYYFAGVCATEKAKQIAAYTLGEYLVDTSGVSSDIVNLFEASGNTTVTQSGVQNAINGVVSAYEIVIDDKGTIRRMSRGTNVFQIVCEQYGIATESYEYLK